MFITAILAAFILISILSMLFLTYCDEKLYTSAAIPGLAMIISACITFLLVYYNVI
jgi:hypothetical protein